MLDIGYYLYPSRYSPPLGHPEMEINLYERPTLQHYDPERALFQVWEKERGHEQITVRHPWHSTPYYRLLPGRIILSDRNSRVVEVFTLGAELEIHTREHLTHCRVKSSAPIFDHLDSNPVISDLIVHFESLLARKRAQYLHDQAAYERRLANIEPVELFIAGLQTIEEDTRKEPPEAHEAHHWEFLHAIRLAIHTLKEYGDWRPAIPNLQTLF